MYIEMKKTGLDVSDIITLVQRKGGGNTGFPYKSFVCRCSNCLYSTKGKCALKECCCMDERIRAHTCTFGEMMRYCLSGIGDNVFHFRLRIAIEREAELKSCFLDAGHHKRFYEGLAYTRKASNNLIAQIFLLSAYESFWLEAKKVLERNCVVYSALEISIKGSEVNPHNLFMTAVDLEYNSVHSDLLDLSDDEVVDFDVFRIHRTDMIIWVIKIIRTAGTISSKQNCLRCKSLQRVGMRNYIPKTLIQQGLSGFHFSKSTRKVHNGTLKPYPHSLFSLSETSSFL